MTRLRRIHPTESLLGPGQPRFAGRASVLFGAVPVALMSLGLLTPRIAGAMPSDPPSLVAAPCGTVQTIEGEVQVLDESRTTTHEARRNELLPCGSWISATRGNLGFKHVDGHVVRLASGAFIQLLSPRSGGDSQEGGIVLFKGMVFAKASGTGPELPLLTSNGRVRFQPGAAGIALWDDGQVETQVLALEGSVRFENRFEPNSEMKVAAGEGSSLNFKLVRVRPTEPAPLPVANVKLKIAEFRLDHAERERLLVQVEKRGERSVLVNLGPVPKAPEVQERKPGEVVTRVTEDRRKGTLVLEERVESIDGGEVAKLSPSSESIVREVQAQATPEAPRQVVSGKRHPAAVGSTNSGGHSDGDAPRADVAPSEDPALNLAKKSEYRKYPGVDDDESARLQTQLARRVAGGGAVGEELEGLMHPDDYRASAAKGASSGMVEVSEVDRRQGGGRRPAKVSSREEKERRRLLDELSKLKPEP